MTLKNTLSKKIIYAAIVTVASGMISCDNIDENERYLKVDPVVPERVVLLEDFTGQNCVNCPDAHAIIEGLQEQYGDAVVAVSIHGGAFAISKDRTSFEAGYIGLGNEEGDYYNNLFSISTWPKGVINRRGVYDYTDWTSVVRRELERPAELGIELNANIINSEAGERIDIDVTLLPQENIVRGYLQVWVLESGIVARQRSLSQGLIQNYVHNNVLRAAVNGDEGEEISLEAGLHNTHHYTIDVRENEKERWNPDNLSIVAFVHSVEGVHQAAVVKVQNDIIK